MTYAGAGEEARLVKLAHNLLVGIITESLAEVTVLAEKGGVAPSAFLDFIDGSVLGSVFIGYKGQAIRTHDYEPTFTTELLRKDFDLGLAQRRRSKCRCRSPRPPTKPSRPRSAMATAIRLRHVYEVAARAAALSERRHQS